MNAFVRWGKFNLVGILGMGLQLTALALVDRAMHGSYLVASAVAVEITLLHNFFWHWHDTWRDRREGVSMPAALTRFHLSNGAVSMLGNLALMKVLVHNAHLPVLIANLSAILCCSAINFFLGDRWTFAKSGTKAVATSKRAKSEVTPTAICRAESAPLRRWRSAG